MDVAAKDAAIARFLYEYPQAADASREHPALHGCEEVRWSEFPGCPAALPVLLYGLLDQAAAAEAQRVLTNTMFSIAEMNPAMPEVLPFLLRLAGDPQVPERSGLLDRLVTVADYSEPIDSGNEAMALWFGSDSDHPERERCRAVFAQHASVVAMLPEGLINPDSRKKLRRAAGLL
ncbi:hypothetical protein ACFC08_36820 [Streptomyces sp. NPDC056112]|uniref:hypothetical protein n=1 Tax=unclassified Streptomyces TaxID=2593676 RepID=UPI001144527A|nr:MULTISPECIES: hypothetical protein [unclassified Streptomyces]GED89312.1 hypothetical protein TNCT6_63970 [Streptomyces sp. 6-11-2]